MPEEAATLSNFVQRRKAIYLATALGLGFLFVISRGAPWTGSKELHTIMEVAATLLALVVGAMALVRFYSKKNNTILFIGAGFLGTAMLDGYHAVVTSKAFAPYLPSDLPALIPWSWVASRFFLSLLLFLSWFVWNWSHKRGGEGKIREMQVYSLVAALTLASFVFFAFAPLPQAYYPDLIFGRPEEFVPAALFLAALGGYLKKGAWKYDDLEHWLVLALIVSVVSQTVFMPLSYGLFDLEFDAAHGLKKVSYLLVLVGLLFSMYRTFRQADHDATELVGTVRELARSNDSLEQAAIKYQQAERVARQSEEKLRTVFETVPDGIVTTNLSGEIQVFNPGAEAIFGYSAEEVIGRNIKILMPDRFAQDHDGHLANYVGGKGASEIGKRRDISGLHKDGTIFAMDLTVNESAREGKERTVTGIIRDVTEQRESADELAQSAADLARSNEELEQFAYVASHDLKAPLRGIDNLAGFLQEDLDGSLDEESEKNFALLQNRIRRMERLLDDLLAYSRAGRKEYSIEDVDLNEMLKDIITLASAPDGFDIQVRCLPCTLPLAHAPLKQVLMNIIGNGIKHHDRSTGKIAVEIDECPEFITFVIEDDGPGIPEQFHDRVFKMFQTLKPRDELEGSGMGLAVVKKVVESAGGSIQIKSTDGVRGTRFTVAWPKIADGG